MENDKSISAAEEARNSNSQEGECDVIYNPVLADGQPRLKKNMGWLGILSAGYNATSSWVVFASTLMVTIPYGTVSTLYGLIVVMIIYVCVGITLAELVSAYPTAGGQYHWTSLLAPASTRRFLSFCCGFLSWFSWMTLASSSLGGAIYCLFAIVSNYHEAYVPQPWHEFLVYQVFNALAVLVNLFLHKKMPKVHDFGFILNVTTFLAILIACLVRQDTKQSSEAVWTSVTDVSGYSEGLQFVISLSAPVIMFCAIDGSAHLAEDVENAAVVVPKTILSGLAISYTTTLAFAIAMVYCITDLDAVMSSASGFPIFEVWRQATHSDTAAVAFACVLMTLLPFGSIACVQVAARMTWSLGRDRGILFSSKLATINPRLDVPAWALCVNAFIMFVLGCLYLFSTIAYNAIIGVAVILQQLTLAIPAILLLYRRRSPEYLSANRKFKVPEIIGWICNIVTATFTIVTTIFFEFPTAVPTTISTMNYASAVLGCVALLALINWFTHARKHYSGPTIELHY